MGKTRDKHENLNPGVHVVGQICSQVESVFTYNRFNRPYA